MQVVATLSATVPQSILSGHPMPPLDATPLASRILWLRQFFAKKRLHLAAATVRRAATPDLSIRHCAVDGSRGFGCNRLLRLGEQTAQAYAMAWLQQLRPKLLRSELLVPDHLFTALEPKSASSSLAVACPLSLAASLGGVSFHSPLWQTSPDI